MVNWNVNQEFIANVGKAGSGKSRYFEDNVLGHLSLKKLWMYDYNGEYGEYEKKLAGYFQPDVGTTDELSNFLEKVFAAGNCTVFVEDGEEAMTPSDMVQRKFFLRARNRNIGGWFNIKAPQSIPPIFRGRFDKLNLFQLTDYRQIEAAETWLGVKTGSMAEIIRGLKPGEHITIDFKADAKISDVIRLPLKGAKVA